MLEPRGTEGLVGEPVAATTAGENLTMVRIEYQAMREIKIGAVILYNNYPSHATKDALFKNTAHLTFFFVFSCISVLIDRLQGIVPPRRHHSRFIVNLSLSIMNVECRVSCVLGLLP